MKKTKEKPDILLVDDEKDLCWAFRMRFKEGPFTVSTVETGEAAVEATEKSSFPVVILDSKLPGIDGFKTAKILKKNAPKTAIIMFSGYHHLSDREIQEGLRTQLFQHFISKPFDFDEVNTLVLDCLK